jgi:hypothetical protein
MSDNEITGPEPAGPYSLKQMIEWQENLITAVEEDIRRADERGNEQQKKFHEGMLVAYRTTLSDLQRLRDSIDE